MTLDVRKPDVCLYVFDRSLASSCYCSVYSLEVSYCRPMKVMLTNNISVLQQQLWKVNPKSMTRISSVTIACK